jgi:AraC-like DNA-binding protein
MSQIRQRLTLEQEPFLAVRSLACGYSSGFVIEPHHHDWHQLLYASAGAMTVQAGRSSWMIPPGKAVFIPARCSHSIRMWGEVALRSLAFPAGPAGMGGQSLAAEECRVLSVTPLLRELILRVISMSALDSRLPAHQRLLAVLLDEMNVAPIAPLALPLPIDSRALAVARDVLRAPANDETLEQLARRFAAGRRTLERLFRAETGMSFGLWRQKVRMLDSVRILSEGKSVTDAAFDSGYGSVSAYIAAFKKTFGCTPRRL